MIKRMVIVMLVGILSALACKTTFAESSLRVKNAIAINKCDGIDFEHRVLESAKPVSIRVMGSRLCVESPQKQMLPIYKGGGSFYCVFRLNKGTNMISGLPSGIYLINKRKVTLL